MIGILVILVVSALLLWFLQKKNLLVLGPLPLGKRLLQLLIGFFVFGLLNLGLVLGELTFRETSWEFHGMYGARTFLEALYYHFKSALTEDLLFRGALLYILIRRLGANTGILISAACFGCYHWFSYGILNEGIVTLAVVFIMTGTMGWAWAYSFHKTRSVFLGLGLHLGWNYAMCMTMYSQPYGNLLVTSESMGDAFPEVGLVFLVLKILVPPAVVYLLARSMENQVFSRPDFKSSRGL